jgi:hypothetical protein
MALFDMGTGLSTLVSGAQQVLTTAGSIANGVNSVANSFRNLNNVTNVGQAIGAVSGAIDSVTRLGQALASVTDPSKVGSVLRSMNLPPGGTFTSNGTAAAFKFQADDQQDWRVKLYIPPVFRGSSILDPFSRSDWALIFPYTPNITISSGANYDEQAVTHQNYQFIYYQNSKSDQIQISAPFNVEDNEQADYWIATLHFLRSVTKMFTGQDPNAGNPPPLCKLSGYGQFVFNSVPVVVRNFSVDLPQDVNYIQAKGTGGLSWVPVKSTLNINLLPIYSRTAARQFSLKTFVEGGYVGISYV